MLTDYEIYSDEQLLQVHQEGDERAGITLCERYWDTLYKFFIKRISGNREDVEDLVQETFLEALKSLKIGQSPMNFRAWLYKIATRVLSRWIQEKQQDRQVSLDTVLEDESAQMALAELLPAPVNFNRNTAFLTTNLGTSAAVLSARCVQKN